MGVSIIGTSGFQRGIESAETGINVASFSCRYFPEFKTKVPNFQGQTTAFAIPDKLSREVSVSGEVTGDTGLMATLFNTATTFANDEDVFVAVSAGTTAGGFYADELTESQTRDGWREFSGRWTADPLIA